MYSAERHELRNVFFEAWRKYENQLVIEPLEEKIVNIILKHPEYHVLLNDKEYSHTKDFVEANPFLHMSLHLALDEQINTNRPFGIQTIYRNLCIKFSDTHLAEHQMMECLAEILWEMQRSGKMIDEKEYLENLKKL